MASKKYDIVAVTGHYTDRQTGEEKARFANIGAVIETDKGFRLKLETVPIDWDGWAALKEPQPRDAAPEPRRRPAAPADDDPNDGIPF